MAQSNLKLKALHAYVGEPTRKKKFDRFVMSFP
jgi:hypothetical protein